MLSSFGISFDMKRVYELLFRPPAPIRELGQLADFIDRHSAFLVQKGIYEYSRARAGHYAKVLFGEAAFLEAIERSRWQGYPLGLAMVGELVEGVLHPHVAGERQAVLRALTGVVLSAFDRYPVPAVLTEDAWRGARAELARRLQLVALHPPKRVIDIPEPLVDSYFGLMPIHEKLRGSDYPTIRNYLKVTLCNIHDALTKRIDAGAVVKLLAADQRAELP